MEGYSRKDDESPQLLDLIPRERDWLAKRASEDHTNHGLNSSGERKLELSLGPPSGDDWTITDSSNTNNKTSQNTPRESLPSFGYFQNPWKQQQQHHQMKAPPFLHLQAVMKEPSPPCSIRAAAAAAEQVADQKKGFSANNNTAVPNSSTAHKRTAPSPVVGWPPIRSFRKNLANGNSSKLSSESSDANPSKLSGSKPVENGSISPFVKINMDGIPIGRKIDLKAYQSYEKLSYAVDELFRDLLAAQSEPCVGETKDRENGGKVIGGLLDGSGEYTLVYEDNEGDRMLVGDVPWHMFVSTVKRLRVLKSSELPKLSCGSKLGKLSS